MKHNMTTTMIVAVATLTIGFFAGGAYQQTKAPSFPGQMGNRTTLEGGRGGSGGQMMLRGGNEGGAVRSGFAPVLGEIIKADDQSITVKLEDGSTKIVLIGDSTQVNKSEKASQSDLVVGEQVSAFGTQNDDGSLTAQSVSLGELQMRFGGAQQEKN